MPNRLFCSSFKPTEGRAGNAGEAAAITGPLVQSCLEIPNISQNHQQVGFLSWLVEDLFIKVFAVCSSGWAAAVPQSYQKSISCTVTSEISTPLWKAERNIYILISQNTLVSDKRGFSVHVLQRGKAVGLQEKATQAGRERRQLCKHGTAGAAQWSLHPQRQQRLSLFSCRKQESNLTPKN